MKKETISKRHDNHVIYPDKQITSASVDGFWQVGHYVLICGLKNGNTCAGPLFTWKGHAYAYMYAVGQLQIAFFFVNIKWFYISLEGLLPTQLNDIK